MTYEEYTHHVSLIKVGKHIGQSVYLHKDAFNELDDHFVNYLYLVAEKYQIDDEAWNIIKLFKKDFRMTYLNYPGFYTESYPPLFESYSVDLTRGKLRKANYKESDNPPILHRKELFIPSSHPRYSEFEGITQEGESIGLYEEPKKIGFKKNWQNLIRRKGYALIEGRLSRLETFVNKGTDLEIRDDIEIERHKAAISRDRLSKPMRLLAENGFINEKYTILDYGCGRGDDLNVLLEEGIDAEGWDPAYRKNGSLEPRDIVNLGFVINVIEDKDERKNTLTTSYDLAKKLLVISSLLGTDSLLDRFRPYKDGVVTKQNTFQKYYSQPELKFYIESTLDVSAIAVGPGVFFIFKDELEEQNYLLNKQKSRPAWLNISRIKKKALNKITADKIIQKNETLFEDFWETLLDLGRMPVRDEFEHYDQLKRTAGSIKKAYEATLKYFGKESLELEQEGKRNDFLVYFALSYFRKRKSYKRMPEGMRRDIKELFHNYTEARNQGKDLLFSIANVNNIKAACVEASQILPACEFDESHHLQFQSKYLNICPKLLRVYINCALQLYGETSNVHLIKAHMYSGKVTLLIYDDWTKKVPMLVERIKINLREQKIEFFDYVGDYLPQPLRDKAKF